MRSIVVAVGAAILSAAPQDDVTKGWKAPWAGAAVGSFLKWKVSEETAGQKRTLERTERVTQVEADSVTVEEQAGEEKNDEQYSLGLPPELEGPWKKTGDEEIKVGERTFKCAVYESVKVDVLYRQTTRVWKSAEAPHWAVKATFTHIQMGMELLGWTEELVRIAETATAAGKELKCRVVRKCTRSPGIEMEETAWLTEDLPDRVARKSQENRIAGMKAGTKLSELVEIGKK
jgi:hypothetical protein